MKTFAATRDFKVGDRVTVRANANIPAHADTIREIFIQHGWEFAADGTQKPKAFLAAIMTEVSWVPLTWLSK